MTSDLDNDFQGELKKLTLESLVRIHAFHTELHLRRDQCLEQNQLGELDTLITQAFSALRRNSMKCRQG
jgi:hypothetical protein